MNYNSHTFLRLLADAAGKETLSRFRKAPAVDNKLSAGFDPVTEGDRAAEVAIRAVLEKHFPGHGILGEEYGLKAGDNVHQWVIDPIDGTRAFIAGLPVWGTLVGLIVEGRAKVGFMSQPFTGEFYFADGEQSYLARGDHAPQSISTAKNVVLDEAIMFTTTPALFDDAGLRDKYNRLERAVKLPRYGCDCYAFAMLASGHAHLVVEPGLQPYDIVALIPLIEQAGGVITTWDGGRAEGGGNVIAASSPQLHGEALSLLNAS